MNSIVTKDILSVIPDLIRNPAASLFLQKVLDTGFRRYDDKDLKQDFVFGEFIYRYKFARRLRQIQEFSGFNANYYATVR